ncbi:Pyruvate kinase, cytosolic isozyme [Morella rubra]|uniref:Pyruvate kinase, cytosolic isozyme n=1 Tax=Morella rubra TaxID=262757 RepID=A0A6A1VKD1_9ROSI|nr:Pyruvate kinase, cytosolic isozyme [Morella rubra]
MARICVEAEGFIHYGDHFNRIIETVPMPMSPLESLVSSAVSTTHCIKAALIMFHTKDGSTAKIVAKYRPRMPILSVVVPNITTDSFDWSCSNESPARHSLIFRGLVPVLSTCSARGSDAESTKEAIELALQHAKAKELCELGNRSWCCKESTVLLCSRPWL